MIELSLHILDIAENSTRAGAGKIEIDIDEDQDHDRLSLSIKDDGKGMDKNTLQNALDPFFTTKKVRQVGLGLPLLAEAARSARGHFSVLSKENKGTVVQADFQFSHIDRQPLGNMADTITALITGNPDVNFIYRHQCRDRHFTFDTRQIKKEIDDVPINHLDVLQFIRQHIEEGLREIGSEAEYPKSEKKEEG
jgi:Histidine kinase-, DNA gyrase B-, and HSP90-like ATPase